MINYDFVESLDQLSSLIDHLYGKIVVVKYGGAAMKDSNLKKKVIHNILLLHRLGIKVILIHGGGPMINHWLNKLNIEPKFENGIRVTDNETMEIVEMVLVGKVNKDLVNLCNKNKGIAIGLSGKDASLAIASKLFKDSQNLVGTIDCVNVSILNLLLDQGYIPIIASVASDINGLTYNINADTFAGNIAEALNAYKLVLITDTPGIMLDINDNSSLQRSLNINQVEQLFNKEIIYGGMIPKVECCIKALKNNVKSTHIIDGRVSHSLLIELLTSNRIGSEIIL
uniref:Acetylglutamate kinase n=1 Tax=Antithamnionella ternifolia TaxID=207919 RepID=A0A4D6WL55_9FLOR|nr:acetylglutamate kinase [Antithamnionella ternifolia]